MELLYEGPMEVIQELGRHKLMDLKSGKFKVDFINKFETLPETKSLNSNNRSPHGPKYKETK